MRQALTWMSVWATAALCGCASRGNVEMLESQLRVQEDRIYALQRELKSAGSELVAARRETESLRTQVAERNVAVPAPEESRAFHRVEAIQIHKFLTGGLDRDDQPGHDQISVVVVPVDAGGELVKVPGTLRIELLDLAADGSERQVAAWDYSAEEAERLWKKGLVGSGYTIQAPLAPSMQSIQSERLTVHARLTTTDGRQFDTTHQVALALGREPGLARKDRRRPARVASKRDAAEPAGRVPLSSPGRGAPPPHRSATRTPEIKAPKEESADDGAPGSGAADTGAPDLGAPSELKVDEPPAFPGANPSPKPMSGPEGKTSRRAPADEPDDFPNDEDASPPIRLTGARTQAARAASARDFDSDWPLPVRDASDWKRADDAAPTEDAEPPFDLEPDAPTPTSDRWTEFDRPAMR